MVEKTGRVIKERRSKNADRTAEQSRNSGTQGNSQTELQTDIRIKTKEAVNKRAAGVARENIAEVKSANLLRDSTNRIKQAHTAKTSKEAYKTANEISDSWTSFKPADYLDVDSSHGDITNLKQFNNQLLFW